MPKEVNLEQELSKYNNKSKIKVNFHQIDALGILYNVQYFIIFENSRLDYLRNLGFVNNLNDIIQKFPVMTANHRIDYLNYAEFGDEIEVYSRISQMGNSSLVFENIAVKNKEILLAKSSTAYVYINPLTKTSTPIPEKVKQAFLDFEHGNIILKSKSNEKN